MKKQKAKSTKKKSNKNNDRKAMYREALKKRTKREVETRDSGNYGTRRQLLNLKEYPDIKWYKPTKGKNIIDIVPYIVTSDNHPQPDFVDKGMLDYKLDLLVHKNVGPGDEMVLCLYENFKKKCPVCDLIKKLQKDPDVDEDVIKSLNVSRRVIYNVIDLNSKSDDIMLFDVSHFLFEKEWGDVVDDLKTEGEEEITPSDLEDGRSITFKAKESSWGGRKFFIYRNFDFIERDPYDLDILDETLPLDALLIIPDYKEIKSLIDDGTDEDEDEDEAPKKSRKRKVNNKKEAVNLNDEDDDDDDDDDEPPFDEDDNDEYDYEEEEEEEDIEEEEEEEEVIDECPEDGTFGIDFNQLDECEDCDEDVQAECSSKFEELEKAKKKKTKKSKKTTTKTKTKKRGKK